MKNQKGKGVFTNTYPASFMRGFTLIELVIALSLIIIITFFLAYLVFYQYWIYNTQSAEINITNDARVSLSTIDDYVRQSNSVESSYSTYQTGLQTLVLQINSIDSSNQIIQNTYDKAVFYLSGTDLKMQIFPDANSSRQALTKNLASNIDVNNFSFSYDNAIYPLVKSVTTNIAIVQAVNSIENKNRTISLSSTSKLRNH